MACVRRFVVRGRCALFLAKFFGGVLGILDRRIRRSALLPGAFFGIHCWIVFPDRRPAPRPADRLQDFPLTLYDLLSFAHLPRQAYNDRFNQGVFDTATLDCGVGGYRATRLAARRQRLRSRRLLTERAQDEGLGTEQDDENEE